MDSKQEHKPILYTILSLIIIASLVYIYMMVSQAGQPAPQAPVPTSSAIVLTPEQIQVRDVILNKVATQNTPVTLTKAQIAVRNAILSRVSKQ